MMEPPSHFIDRAARDDLSGILAGFMRKEILSVEFAERTEGHWNSVDKSVSAVAHLLWDFDDDFEDSPIPVSEPGWEFLRRLLAFLQTDEAVEMVQLRHSANRINEWVAMAGILVTAAAAAAWLRIGSPAIFWVWPMVGILWELMPNLNRRNPEYEDIFRWAPFHTEAEWRKAEAGIARFKLPEFSEPEIRPASRWRFLSAAALGPIVVFIHLIMLAIRRPVPLIRRG